MLVDLGVGGTVIPDCELEGEGDEDAQREDLEGEAREGDVDGPFVSAGRGGGGGAADGLEDEREDVAGDEDPIVEFGGEAGVFLAEVADTVRGIVSFACGDRRVWWDNKLTSRLG